MPHTRNASAAANSTGVRLNALIESALLEADPEHYGPASPPPPSQPSVGVPPSAKRASPIPAAGAPEVPVRLATDPPKNTTPAAGDAIESSALGHAKVSFNLPNGPPVRPPSASQEMSSHVAQPQRPTASGVLPSPPSTAVNATSPARRARNPSKPLQPTDSNLSLSGGSDGGGSSSSHVSLDTISSDRESAAPPPGPPTTRPPPGASTPAAAGRGRTGARLAPALQVPGTSGKHLHTLTLAPPGGPGAPHARGPSAAAALLARSRSTSRHRQASTESTGSMDRGLDASPNPHSSVEAISAPGTGSTRISQLAPTLADRARLARQELAGLQADASAAMRELEAAEGQRKEAEAARLQSEREVESVQRRIEVAWKKRDELEELLEALRVENDELEQQLLVSGGFLNKYAQFVGSTTGTAVAGGGAGASGGEGVGGDKAGSKEGSRGRTASSGAGASV